MILGVGCDIVRISRISYLIDKYGNSFKKRIFTETEISYANTMSQRMQYNYYAKRFAGKEALSKAFGTGISAALGFLDISIINDQYGAPKIICNKLCNKIGHISLSDEDDFAIAYVILES